MSPQIWSLLFFLVYAVVTAYLAWKGGQKMHEDAEAFAIGDGQMSPLMAGLTLGASLASSSTFVIVPGFVYKDGLAALVGFTLPFVAGLAAGLLLLAPAFQRSGVQAHALTIPHWLGARYDSLPLRRLFAALNVLQLAYLVLITVGCAYVMQAALGLPYAASVVLIVVFVFGYTGFGGTWAHAFTNSMQAVVMLIIALAVFASGLSWWTGGQVGDFFASGTLTAPGSPLFSTPAEVWAVQFVMGVALTAQPHLLTKALYVDGERALGRTVGLGLGIFALYCLVLFAGVYARFALPADVPQDQLMAQYLQVAFPLAPVAALASTAILAASMSTLDGLLVAISASVANDAFPGTPSVLLQRGVLVGLAVATIAIALNPPSVVLILGQSGVYGLVVASAGPLVAGLFRDGPLDARAAIASALLALAVHFGLFLSGWTGNPGVSACLALPLGLAVAWFAPPPVRHVARAG